MLSVCGSPLVVTGSPTDETQRTTGDMARLGCEPSQVSDGGSGVEPSSNSTPLSHERVLIQSNHSTRARTRTKPET
jgi:hypothetical protein